MISRVMPKHYLPVFILISFFLAACSGADIETPQIDNLSGENNKTILLVPFGSDLPQGAMLDTASITDSIVDEVLPQHPGIELQSVDFIDNLLVFVFTENVLEELCQDVFSILDIAPDCETAIVTGPYSGTGISASPLGTAPTQGEVASSSSSSNTMNIPFEDDLPQGAILDTHSFDEVMATSILPTYPDAELLSVIFEDGELVFEFSIAISTGLCETMFMAFDQTPDCDAYQALGEATESDDAATIPLIDEAKVSAAVNRILPSVVMIRGDSGLGTGFFYTANGYILTNRHVVVGSTNFEVLLYDGRVFAAELVGIVENTGFGDPDLAVLKIDATNLPAVELGDSSNMEYGESISIIGHPADYGNWLATSGYFDRSVGTDIVSTAPASEGASGAPMFDENGQVVGLLWGQLGSTSALPEPAVPSESVQVIWTWREFQSLRTHSSWGVAINVAAQLADAIITSGGNVDRTAAYQKVDYTVEGNLMVVESQGLVEIEAINNFFLSGVPEQVSDASYSAGYVTLTFNRDPSPEAIEAVLDMFKEMNATSVDTPPLDEYSTRIERAESGPFSSHPDDQTVTELAERNIESVVFLRTLDGQGTGFFITSDGYILTNAHVIKEASGAGDVEVTLYDGRVLSGRIVGFDEDQTPDVGIIKVEGTGFPTVNIGSSTGLQVGDTAFVIGHPGGYGYWIVTGGEMLDLRGGSSGIDLTAASQQGSSGSPIFDIHGDVVGLLWGREGGEIPEPERLITEIIWTWSDFWALAVDSQFSTGATIETAIARANEIILAQGNVP